MNQSQVTFKKLEEVKEEAKELTSPINHNQITSVANEPSSMIEDEYSVQQTFIEESVADDVAAQMSQTVIEESITDLKKLEEVKEEQVANNEPSFIIEDGYTELDVSAGVSLQHLKTNPIVNSTVVNNHCVAGMSDLDVHLLHS